MNMHFPKLLQKCSVILLPLLLIKATASAVPKEAEESFEKQYPDAKDVDWEVDRNGYWEAGFKIDDTKFRADFEDNGKWIETETNIEFSELPDKVQKAIRKDYPDDEITEIEKVDNALRGTFFDVEFKRAGKNQDVEYIATGERMTDVVSTIESAAGTLMEPIPELQDGIQKDPRDIGRLELLLEFAFNLLTILIFAYFLYYRRHHDHKMLFLLLGFNLFLFPIFLLNSVLTAGFGFTIFALLALVRLRSENFDKTEVAYLMGAVALTFVNSVLPAKVEYIASIMVLCTAYFGDHPRLWRDAYQTIQLHYPLDDMKYMLDIDFLHSKIEEEFGVEVNDIEITRVEKKKVRLKLMYREKQDVRRSRTKGKSGLANRKKRKKNRSPEANALPFQELTA
ncbi:MAG: hypothetical protein CMO55_02075 [Verrucomicrobiales bacterium]|nr:hypothetical protein [Verrucomicrobiales bacterium]